MQRILQVKTRNGAFGSYNEGNEGNGNGNSASFKKRLLPEGDYGSHNSIGNGVSKGSGIIKDERLIKAI